jgi:hypothetical protein
MPKKIQSTTKEYLVNVPLPNHGSSYTVISHKSIMDYALTEIKNQGFTVVDEFYRATHDGQIAQGVYKLNYGKDTELSLMFAWSNSYNKQVRFRCVVGGFINTNGTVMITGDMGNYARKHTGTADQETIDNMKDQLTNAAMYYDTLYNAKEAMKKITLTSRKKAELLGILFAEYNILTTEQASIIRQQMDKPSFFYAGGADSLWTFYNHATLALQQSHPRTWLEDQRLLHWFMESEFNLNAPTAVVDPNAIPVLGAVPVPNATFTSSDALLAEEIATVEAAVNDPLAENYGQPENQTNLLTQIAELEAETVTDTEEEISIDDTQSPTVSAIQDRIAKATEEVETEEEVTEEASDEIVAETEELEEDDTFSIIMTEDDDDDDDFSFDF